MTFWRYFFYSHIISFTRRRAARGFSEERSGANVAKVGGLVDLFWREVEKDLKEEVEKVAITMRRERRLTVEFWWSEVAELQPSKSLHETTQPFTYLGSKCQDVTRY